MMHRHQLKVRFYELDPYNHVNHSAYIQYFEVARIELLDQLGFGLARLQELGCYLVVTQIQTKFTRSAGPGDVLVVETEIGEMKRASASWRQRILRDGELIAEQEVGFAATDPDGRPRRFPEGLAEAFATYREDG